MALKPHDYSSLNDAQCVHVDHFAERLKHWRERSVADATAWQVARREARERIALDEAEQAGADEYVTSRFEMKRAKLRPEGRPVRMLVVG